MWGRKALVAAERIVQGVGLAAEGGAPLRVTWHWVENKWELFVGRSGTKRVLV